MDTKANPKFKSDLEQIIALAVEMYSPAKIVLFGSQARGDWTEESDLDILLVDCEIKRPMGEIHSALYRLKNSAPVDFLKTNSSDIDAKKNIDTNVVTIALNEGVVIYQK